MNPTERSVLRDCADAAVSYADAQPWTLFGSLQLIALRFAGDSEPWFASVLGSAGEQFGLALYRGQAGLRFIRTAVAEKRMDDDLFDPVAYCGFLLHAPEDLEAGERKLLRNAGWRPGERPWVPTFLAKEPGRQARSPRPDEARRLARAARTIVASLGADGLRPDGDGARRFPVLDVPEHPPARPAPVRFEAFEETAAPRARAVRAPPNAGRSEPGGARWIAGLPALNAAVRGDDRTIRVFLLVDEATGMVLATDILQGRATAHDAAIRLVSKIEEFAAEQDELPGEIVITSRALHEVAAPALAKAGVRCPFETSVPVFDEVFESLSNALTRQRRG